MGNIVVAALYHFVDPFLEEISKYKENLLARACSLNIKGTLLLAPEGINGTIAGSSEDIEKILEVIRSLKGFELVKCKFSYTNKNPFYRMKVKLKKEIVTLGVPGVNVVKDTGYKVSAKDWDNLISSKDVVLIDTRNDYEIGIGTFKGAIDPKTVNFREFPDFIDKYFNGDKKKKIAMFCTGGIRCEKASAYMRKEGYDQVYQLDGGILKYLEEKKGKDSMWEGDCFVFDNRVSVDNCLAKGKYDQCYACRMPITQESKLSSKYVEGISCDNCFDKNSNKQKERFIQRQKQIELSKERGCAHIGVNQKQV